MTWLALAPWQAWAIAAVIAVAVAWLFLLRLRHPARAVPSLVLWTRALEQERPQTIAQWLRRVLSFLLILLVAWLLGLAPGRPALAGRSGASALTLVIDTAPSMATRMQNGRTRLDAAKARARALLAESGPSARVRLIDTAGRVSTAAGLPASEIGRALDQVSVWPGPDRLPALDERAGDVIVLTDGVRRRPWPPRARRVAVFELAANVGITAFGVRALPDQPLEHDAYVEVANESAQPQHVELALTQGNQIRIRRSLDLAAGARVRDVIALSGLARGEVLATVSAPGDAFPLDDAAVAYLAATDRVRTLLVTDGFPPLETALGLDPIVELTTVRPAQLKEAREADVVVLDGVTPPQAPVIPALLIHAGPAPWLDGLARVEGEVVRPAVRRWDETDPLLRFVRGADVRIDRTARLVMPQQVAGVRAPASADDTPLIIAGTQPVRRVLVGFDLRQTDFPFQAGFPLFVRNTVLWLAGVRSPIEAAAGSVAVPWPGAEIVTASGTHVAARRLLDATVFDAREPGVFLARVDGDETPIVVNATGPSAPDVNDSEFAHAPPDDRPVQAGGGHEYWPTMLIVAFALATLEWVTFHRRLTL